MANTLHMTTVQGNMYRIYQDGCIQRLDLKDFHPSTNWRLLYLERRKEKITVQELFKLAEENRIVEFESYAKNNGEIVLRHKNRKARYTVIDYDHGTLRGWSDGPARIILERE